MNLLKSMYMLEELLNKKRRVIKEEYPLLSKQAFLSMEIEAIKCSEFPSCFVFYRQCGSISYVDLYIFDIMMPVTGYKRFVIVPNYCFSRVDEELFIKYISASNIVFDENSVLQVADKIKLEHPEVNLKLYDDMRHMILHIYFTFQRNILLMELLYKAGLNHIAFDLCFYEIEDINYIASSPQEMFGLNIEMLRAVNYSGGVENIISKKNRDVLNKVYTTFHNYIYGMQLNKYQILYLQELLYRTKPDKKTIRAMLKYLANFTNEVDYHLFMRYSEFSEIVKDYYENIPPYPAINELDYWTETVEYIEFYIEKEEYFNKKYYKALHYNKKYEYEGNRYKIFLLPNIFELLNEGSNQKNCLVKFIWPAALGETIIMVMRKKELLSKSLITLEIKNSALTQAYRACNEIPNEEELEFLEEYAREKKLKIALNYKDEAEE